MAEHREEPARHKKAVDAHFGWPHASGTLDDRRARTRQRARHHEKKDLKPRTKAYPLFASKAAADAECLLYSTFIPLVQVTCISAAQV